MPLMTNVEFICKKCKQTKDTFRMKWHSKNKKYYRQSTCYACEKKATKEWFKENKDKVSEYNYKAYLNKVGTLSRIRPKDNTEERRKSKARDKVDRRYTRAKDARVSWDVELTEFIFKEAQDLRKLRNKLTYIDWHVDHIIPLKGENVCGLHVWNNFAVIPKVDNLRKGNYYSTDD